ncbi:hypothetical protein BDM02DRAFT_3266424 [Thelephora ganbajun]|uniref:Uncharacterized protein n=1 Tax=Thelephora ganbajun TaxID=370292 RepID=A0ACB6ZSF7_THEGA|nr:hypothetical protein BDM02DRAFT_3266424 [Thelephora ganbajun]
MVVQETTPTPSTWAEVYTLIEVKISDDLDRFANPPNGGTPPEYQVTIDVTKNYPNEKEATRQFRTWVYSIPVAGTTARLLHWDRPGVIVTESFNCKSNPEILIGFVWRFSKATNEQRGFDRSKISGVQMYLGWKQRVQSSENS